MARFLVVKHLGALRPVDQTGEDVLRGMGQGEMVEVEIRRRRHPQHHRLFWAMMSLVWDQLDHGKYPTVEDLVTEAKIVTGHYDRRDMVIEGRRYPVLTPKSISFGAMDQAEFSAFFDRVCDWIVRDILPGVSREDVIQELEIMTGARSQQLA